MKKETYSWLKGVISPAVAAVVSLFVFWWLLKYSTLGIADMIGTMIVIYFLVLWKMLFWLDKLQKERRKRK